jgi:hypothetical protein
MVVVGSELLRKGVELSYEGVWVMPRNLII